MDYPIGLPVKHEENTDAVCMDGENRTVVDCKSETLLKVIKPGYAPVKKEENTDAVCMDGENRTVVDCKSETLLKVIKPGYAPVKKDFIIVNHTRKLVTDYMPEHVAEELQAAVGGKRESESEVKGPRKKRAKLRGKTRHRPIFKQPESSRICPQVVRNVPCQWGDNCRFNHNVADYLATKAPDIEGSCFVYDTLGVCPFSFTCRFSGSHTTEDGKNIVNEELRKQLEGQLAEKNKLASELQQKLRKRLYDFSRADAAWQEVSEMLDVPSTSKKYFKDNALSSKALVAEKLPPQIVCKEMNDKLSAGDIIEEIMPPSQTGATSSPPTFDSKLMVGTYKGSTDVIKKNAEGIFDKMASQVTTAALGEDLIRLRPQEKRKVNFEDKLYLAPLTTVGNLPFRRVCKTLGADITCGEMAFSTNLLQGQSSEWALLKRHASEDLFGVQICGSYPDTMTRCAQLLTETCDIDFIDINCGCPIDVIFKKGQGCALMGRASKMEQVVRSMTSVMDGPLTLKMRTGIYESQSTAHELVPKLRDWGLSALTIHGRSREQRYTKLADWQYLQECANLASPMPFFGNGDVLSYEDYNRYKDIPGLTGIMIGRGALIKPWLFTEIKEQRHWDISAQERFDILKQFANFGMEHWGSDDKGVSNTRRFLLEWLSFLHRYIPVGLLEHLPQKINEKPPHYFGRSELETLLASPSYTDWIKISEMLLGRVPDGFTFVPKHKANAYQ